MMDLPAQIIGHADKFIQILVILPVGFQSVGTKLIHILSVRPSMIRGMNLYFMMRLQILWTVFTSLIAKPAPVLSRCLKDWNSINIPMFIPKAITSVSGKLRVLFALNRNSHGYICES
jgi:hypothetical protein